MRPDASRLGANVGFGYLTDDDDDDAAGGGTSDLFDALFASYDTTRNVSQSSTFTLAITANSAQTNGVVVVTITEPSASAVSPSTVSLDGWTQTGWSHAGTTWTNTLTKASVSSGTTGPSFSFTCSAVGTVTLSTASTPPETTEAIGGGQSVNVTIGGAATFDATVASPADTPGWSYATPFDCTITATAGGISQTNGEIRVGIYDNYYPSSIVSGITTTDPDTWAESGWVYSAGVWSNTYTRTSVVVGTTNPVFRVTCVNSGDVYVSTQVFTAPKTSEATGVGNNFTAELV